MKSLIFPIPFFYTIVKMEKYLKINPLFFNKKYIVIFEKYHASFCLIEKPQQKRTCIMMMIKKYNIVARKAVLKYMQKLVCFLYGFFVVHYYYSCLTVMSFHWFDDVMYFKYKNNLLLRTCFRMNMIGCFQNS